MKTTHARMALAALFLALALVAAGCGNEGGEEATTSGDPATTPASGDSVDAGAAAEEAGEPAPAVDADDEEAWAALARTVEVDVEAFEAPRMTRGGRNPPPITLVWPQADVRPEGLTTYAIEVSERYGFDGRLEFRQGRDVLYSQPFEPESRIVIGQVPEVVREAAGPRDRLTWGVTFDDDAEHDDVEAKVRVVDHPRAERRIARIREARHLERQPAIVRELLVAEALLNYRLYTEALQLALELQQQEPTQARPYKIMVAALRRLDAEDTLLWELAAPNVSGRGRPQMASGAALRPFATPPTAPPPALLRPQEPGAGLASRDGQEDGGRRLGPGGAITPGARPPAPEGEGETPEGGAAVPPAAGEDVGGTARSPEVARALEEAERRQGELALGASQAQEAAAQAAEEARQAERDLREAQDELARLERILREGLPPGTPSPGSPAELQRQIEEARTAAAAAQADVVRAAQEALAAAEQAEAARVAAETARQEAEALRQALAAPSGRGPEGSAPQRPPEAAPGEPSLAQLEAAVRQTQAEAAEARETLADFEARLAEAQALEAAGREDEARELREETLELMGLHGPRLQAAFDAAREAIEALRIAWESQRGEED